MINKLVSALFCVVTTVGLVSRAQEIKTSPPLTVTVDRADALYRQRETVTFQIKASANVADDAEIGWKISKDGVPPIQSGTVKLTQGSAQITARLDEPGFLNCRVTVTADNKPVLVQAGAGIDPLKIRPSLPVPDDFNTFWQGNKQKLAAVPIKAAIKPVPSPQNVEAFDVQVDALGAPASGYFARPREAQPRSLPIILIMQGAGVTGGNLGQAVSWAQKGMLAMNINAHGLINGQPHAFYEDLANGALKDYGIDGRDSRETCYFLGMFLRALRALDFLCTQPEWDGKTVIAYGPSQGGYQALATAALDDRVTFCVAGIPAGCDHSGMVAGRIAGWPKIVPMTDGKPDTNVLEAARYFDSVNFAARTKAKGAFLTTGFSDPVCPPTTVYAAFNALPVTDKKIYNDIHNGHVVTPATEAAMIEATRAHVSAMKSGARRQ